MPDTFKTKPGMRLYWFPPPARKPRVRRTIRIAFLLSLLAGSATMLRDRGSFAIGAVSQSLGAILAASLSQAVIVVQATKVFLDRDPSQDP
jgi:hypothetical protein